MNKYLVIDFNRYDTDESEHATVEAINPLEALLDFLDDGDEDDTREYYTNGQIQKVSDDFSCVPGEENDYLIYLI